MKLTAHPAGQVYFARKAGDISKHAVPEKALEERQTPIALPPKPPQGPSWLKKMALWSAGLGTLLSGFGLTRDAGPSYQPGYMVQMIPEKPVSLETPLLTPTTDTRATLSQDQIRGVIEVSKRYDLKDDPMVAITYRLHYTFEARKMPFSVEELQVAQSQLDVENANSPLLQLSPREKTTLLMQKALEYRIQNTFQETLRWQLREVSSTELGEKGEGLIAKLRAGFVEEDYIDFQQIVQLKSLNFGDGVTLNEIKLVQVQKEDENGKKLLVSNLTL